MPHRATMPLMQCFAPPFAPQSSATYDRHHHLTLTPICPSVPVHRRTVHLPFRHALTPAIPPVIHHQPSNTKRSIPPTCEWVRRTAAVTVEGVDCNELFDAYSDLTAMPQWSPWLRKVEVDKVDPAVSKWTLAARGFTVSWKARNTSVQRGKLIAWQSVTGVANRGNVTFTPDPTCPHDTILTLTVEFSAPRAVASLLRSDFIGRFVQSTLVADLRRFRTIALRNHLRRTLPTTLPTATPAIMPQQKQQQRQTHRKEKQKRQ